MRRVTIGGGQVRPVAAHPVAIVVAVIGLAVVLPAGLAAASGNLAIPHNDSWAYSLIAEHFARTGAIRLVGANRAFIVGQVVVLGPLGRSIVAQQVFVVILAAAALALTFALLRLALPARRAAFGTAVLAAFPGFGLLATSFMSDIPAYFAIVVTLLVGQIAIKRGSLVGLAVAVAIGVWGFTIREQSVAAVACVLISAFVAATDRAARARVVALAAGALTAVLLLEAWRLSLPNGDAPGVALVVGQGTHNSIRAFFEVGLLVFPAAVATIRPSAWSTAARWAAAFAALSGGALLARYHGLLLGNYLDPSGAYSGLLGTRVVLPSVVWHALQLVSWIGGVLLAGALVDGMRRLGPVLGLFGLLTALGIVLEALTGAIYDRYLLPLVPVALVAVLCGSNTSAVGRWRVVAAGISLAALCAVTLVITANGFAFDSARWDAAESLVHRGVNSQTIDTGLEWVGYHSRVPEVAVAPSKQRAALPGYAQSLFPRAPECYVMSTSPDSGLGRVVEVFHYRTYLVVGRSRLLLYDTGRCRGAGFSRF